MKRIKFIAREAYHRQIDMTLIKCYHHKDVYRMLKNEGDYTLHVQTTGRYQYRFYKGDILMAEDNSQSRMAECVIDILGQAKKDRT